MKQILYTGLRLPQKTFSHANCPNARLIQKNSSYFCTQCGAQVTHEPLIQTVPLHPEITQILSNCTHILLTSQTTVELLAPLDPQKKQLIAIGKQTAHAIEKQNWPTPQIAKEETSEGIITLLQSLPFTKDDLLFWPHSAKSRPLIRIFLQKESIPFKDVALYDTHPVSSSSVSPDIFDEILFTSPSTVHAFLYLFGCFPSRATLTAIGPVTERCLEETVMR